MPRPAHRLFGILGALSLAGASAPADARAPFASAPKPNEIQAKYLDFVNEAGGLACKPKGKLQELLSDPYKCYLDLDECAASRDAVTGKLDPAFIELFGDLLVQLPGEKVEFAYACPGGDDPRFLEGLAIQGIGYAKAAQHLDKLLALATPEKLKSFSAAAMRELLVNALVAMGPAHKDKTVPALVNLVKAEARTLTFKKTALQALARYGSDDAVAWCLEQLKSGESRDVHMSCAQYLGERKAPGALEVLQRNFEKNRDEVARAMGLLGDKGGAEMLATWVGEQSPRVTVPGIVALINLGQEKEYLPMLTALLEGRIPLTKKELDKKGEELAKAKKPKDKERVQKKWAEKTEKVDANVAQVAAMEATLVVNAAVEKKVTEALQAAAKNKDAKEWKVRVYALLALAQRGDKAAAAEVTKLLADPKEEIRTAALHGIGGLYDQPGATFQNRGKGVVVEAALVGALNSFIENEPRKDLRAKALHGAAAVRSFE